eukprot:c7814_g1_i1.p1 GENE.c7814_g1_i1~~c7814_g1_i1.p1  ORF type:complete len:500 (+),score=134.79 c7814_g1_i1:1-1500(+)
MGSAHVTHIFVCVCVLFVCVSQNMHTKLVILGWAILLLFLSTTAGLSETGFFDKDSSGDVPFADDVDHGNEITSRLVDSMEEANNREMQAKDQLRNEAEETMRWSPVEKQTLMSTTYGSVLDQPMHDAVSTEVRSDEKLEAETLEKLGLVKGGGFPLLSGGSETQRKSREVVEDKLYTKAAGALEQMMKQVQSTVGKVEQLAKVEEDKQNQNTADQELQMKMQDVSDTAMAAAFTALDPKIPLVVRDSPQTLNQLSVHTTNTNKDVGTNIAQGLSQGTLNTLAMIGASTLPAALRGFLRANYAIQKNSSEILSHDSPAPHQKIESVKGQGFTADYYAALASAKDIPMWWQHSGAHVAPPWFQSNAPPNRAHLGRASVNVPNPPFIDSPYRSPILDYWTGKRSRFVAPVPKQWPIHHMMAGPWNGEGSMRCPCPGAPQLMCDCQAIEHDTSQFWMKKPDKDDKAAGSYKMERALLTGGQKVLNNFLRAPYPEMALMSMLI